MRARRQAGPSVAPAKLNLSLEILGRRPDGYHELESLVVFVDLGDEIFLEQAQDLSLTLSGPFADSLGSGSDNLVLRAARRLAEAAAIEPRAQLRLVKNLPVGAGLGGGSSDAAETLKALNRFWHLHWPEERLIELAGPLGADLPVCLYARPALMRGTGDRLQPAPPLPAFSVLLVKPRCCLETALVYEARRGPFSRASRWWQDPLKDAGELAALLGKKSNDLEAAARRLCPDITQVLSALEQTPHCLLARMSGSGASCFGLYRTITQAQSAAAALAADRQDWWIVPARVQGTLPDP